MNTHQVMWILAVILVLIAGWVDWRTRRIPNWLTVSGFLFGIAANSLLAGWQGAKSSVEGAGLALLLLLPLVLLRAFGAGDWKLREELVREQSGDDDNKTEPDRPIPFPFHVDLAEPILKIHR